MNVLRPEFFRRIDERPDALFYRRPRTASHLDDEAMRFVRDSNDELLPGGGRILDLMAGSCSHLGDRYAEVVGLGLNADELHANPTIGSPVLFDLNRNAELPFEAASFDGAVCTVSVQYMTRPLDTFASLARALRPGAPFVVAISTRMFEQKAVLAWRASDAEAHLRLVRTYFEASGGFGAIHQRHHRPSAGVPVTLLWAAVRDVN